VHRECRQWQHSIATSTAERRGPVSRVWSEGMIMSGREGLGYELHLMKEAGNVEELTSALTAKKDQVVERIKWLR
jgi:hypothetical protein